MARRGIAVSLMLCLLRGFCLPPPVAAIFGIGDVVWDPTNYVQNLSTAIATAEQARLLAQDLSILQDLSAYTETISQATRLASLVSQLGQRMLGRYSRWVAMIPGGQTIPCTVQILLDWNRLYDVDTKNVLFDMAQASQLVTEGAEILTAVQHILDIARGISGSVSGLQSLHSVLSRLLMATTTMQTMRGPMDEQSARESMRAMVNREAHVLMSFNRRAGMHGIARLTCQRLTAPELS